MMIEDKPIPDDLFWVRLRALDEMECAAAGMTGAEAVRVSAQGATEAHMVCIDGEPVAFWGFNLEGYLNQYAHGWLLTLDAVGDYNYRLARVSRRVVNYILTHTPTLVVLTHIEHKPACRWLEWLGFTPFLTPEPSGLQYMIKRRG